jgi:thiazole synthase ThiGH ThiG subunit
VVAYTSNDLPADQNLLREIGIDAVLPKVGDAQAFRDCVMHWCAPIGSPTLARDTAPASREPPDA